jgi:hypothetical protein
MFGLFWSLFENLKNHCNTLRFLALPDTFYAGLSPAFIKIVPTAVFVHLILTQEFLVPRKSKL